MLRRLTTICCSALALGTALIVCAASRASASSDPVHSSPPSIFPLRTLWTLNLNRGLSAPPAYDGTNGFFPLAGGQVVAYDFATGQQLWITDAATKTQPAAGDGLLFVVTDHAIVALQQADGTERWQLALAAADISTPLVWDNGWLIVASDTGHVLALRARDGRQIWERDLGAPLHARPALSADRVHFPMSNSHVVALRVTDGEPLWERRLGDLPNDILALDNRIYVGSNDKYFYCIDEKGIVRWRFRTGAAIIEPSAFDAHRVYFISRDNILRAMNRRTGAQEWRRSLSFRVRNGPIVVDSTVAVGGTEAVLHTFRISDGQSTPDIPAPAIVVTPPHVLRLDAAAPAQLLVVAEDLDKGAIVTAVTRSLDPQIGTLASLVQSLAKMPGSGMPVPLVPPAPKP